MYAIHFYRDYVLSETRYYGDEKEAKRTYAMLTASKERDNEQYDQVHEYLLEEDAIYFYPYHPAKLRKLDYPMDFEPEEAGDF